MRKLLTAAMLAGLLLCAAPLTAHADAPPQVAALCSDAPNGCSLRHDAWMRDGATYSVVVTGNPGVRVEVVVYLATVENGTVTGLSPLITGNEVLTDSSGVARATVTIPPITDGRPGGWALVSLGVSRRATWPPPSAASSPSAAATPRRSGTATATSNPPARSSTSISSARFLARSSPSTTPTTRASGARPRLMATQPISRPSAPTRWPSCATRCRAASPPHRMPSGCAT